MAEHLPDILLMRPYFREMVWGGRRLGELFGKDLPADRKIGESFELSAYPGRESTVAAGPLAGRSLGSLVEEYGEELLGSAHGERFPLLIKLLDAWEDLSVQVHPDDAYARLKGLADSGKAEAWYVLHADGGRVAHGLKEGVDRESFLEAVRQKRVEEVIQYFAVRPGEVIFSPPGTVHALCAGVVLYEVQQSSDLTFRIWDYGRPRELHLQEALEVIDFEGHPTGPVFWRQLAGVQSEGGMLAECEHFRLHLHAPEVERLEHGAGDACMALTVVEGRAACGGYLLGAGETVLVPARREFSVARQGDEKLVYLIASAS